jgi:hypothetical protein
VFRSFATRRQRLAIRPTPRAERTTC